MLNGINNVLLVVELKCINVPKPKQLNNVEKKKIKKDKLIKTIIICGNVIVFSNYITEPIPYTLLLYVAVLSPITHTHTHDI